MGLIPLQGEAHPTLPFFVLVMQAGISKGKKSTINPQGLFSPSSTLFYREWQRKVNGSLVKTPIVAPFAVVPKHSIFSQPPSLSMGGEGWDKESKAWEASPGWSQHLGLGPEAALERGKAGRGRDPSRGPFSLLALPNPRGCVTGSAWVWD